MTEEHPPTGKSVPVEALEELIADWDTERAKLDHQEKIGLRIAADELEDLIQAETGGMDE